MANVFISYSRKDKEAARKLAEACKAQDLEVWIDWEGIEPTVDWWKEVEKGIEGADNFLFLISPDSTSSPVCKRELDHAIQNGKRLIPVVVRATKSDTVTSELRTLNWIHLGEAESTDDFESAFGKLIRAINTDYDWVQAHRQLQVKALEWERSNRENSFLLRGKELQEAESQLATNTSKEPHPTDLQREYALASRQAADRQRRITTGITVIVGIVLAALAIFGWVQAGRATTNAQRAESESTRAFHNATTAQAASTLALDNAATAQANAVEAQRQEKIARARELAAEARAEDQPIRSLLFSVEAFQRLDDQAQRNSLLSGLQNSPNLKTMLHGHGASVWAAAFSPDGKTLAAGAANGTVTLWNVSDLSHPLQLGDTLDSHTPDVWSVAFSPDGKTLAAGTVDHPIVFWDVSNPATPKQLGEPLTGHFEDVRRVVFSPDGKTLASSGCGNKEADVCVQGQIILWDVSDPSAPTPLGQPISAHSDDVWSLAFRPDGKTLASGSWDNTIILWNVSDLQAPTQLGSPLSRHTGPVLGLAFGLDGNVLASGSFDETIILWDVSSPAAATPLGEPLRGHEDQVWSVAFSPDGKTLASGSTDDNIILWDVSKPESPAQVGAPLVGHTNNVLSVVFSPDGRTLASGSVDQTVILWDVLNPPPPLQVGSLLLPNDFVWTMDFSPDGKTLAAGSLDASVNLLDVSNPEVPQQLSGPLSGHTAEVWSVAFSPDGKTLASASCGTFDGDACVQGQIILWDVSIPGAPVQLGNPLSGHNDRIQSIFLARMGVRWLQAVWIRRSSCGMFPICLTQFNLANRSRAIKVRYGA